MRIINAVCEWQLHLITTLSTLLTVTSIIYGRKLRLLAFHVANIFETMNDTFDCIKQINGISKPTVLVIPQNREKWYSGKYKVH